MTFLASLMFAETLVLGAGAAPQGDGPVEVVVEAQGAQKAQAPEKKAKKHAHKDRKHTAKDKGASTNAVPRTVRVTSDRSTYLRKDGVLAFEGNVCVDDVEFKMHAREVNLFLEGTNELKRVVAIGDVVVTNGLRNGSCAKATYNKALSKVVLYGDPKTGTLAVLRDEGKRKSMVEGRKITFWVDTEQVEVEGSTVTVDAGNLDAKGGAKSLFGK